MKKTMALLCAAFLTLLCGCTGGTGRASVGSQIVTGISVTCQSSGEWVRRDYTAPEKVRLVLLVIRSLGPDFPARTDVEALAGKTMVITLHCADGSATVYRIRNNQYLQKNGGIWRQISEKKTGGLWQLIQEMPSDQEKTGERDRFAMSAAGRIYLPVLRRIGGFGEK